MKELSLHILDIAKNSTAAGASLVEITVEASHPDNCLTITIRDDGKGMSSEFLARVKDPFTTSRTTRKVGMGIPLFELSAMSSGGGLDITSASGEGTTVTAYFALDHIDRQPLGDVASTLTVLIQGSPAVDFLYRHTVDNAAFELDTRQVRQILQGVAIDGPDVIKWLYDYITEGINNLGGNLI